MHSSRLSFHPLLLAVFGLASGALALGATSFGGAVTRGDIPSSSGGPPGASPSVSALPIVARQPESFLAIPPPEASLPRLRHFPALFAAPEREGMGPDPAGLLLPEPEAPAPETLRIPALANNQILAFYGKPDSKSMGIVGEYSKEELAQLLDGYARLYDEENGSDGVVPAFYLIYGTCWPGGEIGYLKDSVVRDYIEFARQKGYIVFLDHQIGKYQVAEAMARLLPWLKYPNVHIALDPEWRTESPMREIGSVSADEINAAEGAMSDFLAAEGIQEQKMLVIHQFKVRMIPDRERIRADYDGVLLIHTADGFGPPALKRASYSFNAKAENMPLKGFKLFFKTEVEGAGYDEPLLLPAEVLALNPAPRLIIYQ